MPKWIYIRNHLNSTSFLYFVYFVGKFVPIQIVKDHSKSRYIVFFSTYREKVQEISKIRTNLALDFTNKIQYNFFYKKHICKNSLFVPVLLILFSYVHNFHYFFRDIKNWTNKLQQFLFFNLLWEGLLYHYEIWVLSTRKILGNLLSLSTVIFIQRSFYSSINLGSLYWYRSIWQLTS